jgi:hypothetical protein
MVGICYCTKSQKGAIELTVVIIVEHCYQFRTKFSNILLSSLSPYINEIVGNHQYGFRRNRSNTDQIICIRQVLEKKWEYNETIHQLFVDFKKAYDSISREVLYNILRQFGVTMRQVRLIKMCLKETYIKVCIGKYLSDNIPIQNGLKQRYDLSTLLFNFAL